MQNKTMTKKVKWALKNHAVTRSVRSLFEDFLTSPKVPEKLMEAVRTELNALERGWK